MKLSAFDAAYSLRDESTSVGESGGGCNTFYISFSFSATVCIRQKYIYIKPIYVTYLPILLQHVYM